MCGGFSSFFSLLFSSSFFFLFCFCLCLFFVCLFVVVVVVGGGGGVCVCVCVCLCAYVRALECVSFVLFSLVCKKIHSSDVDVIFSILYIYSEGDS